MKRLAAFSSLLTIALSSVALAQRGMAPGNDMVAMHCGGDMAGMMSGMAMGQRGMPGMRGDTMMQRMMGDTAMHRMMMDMMGPPSPAMILGHKDQLGLSASQVTRLESLQSESEKACATHMNLAMTAHRAANQMLEANRPNFDAYAAKLKEATGHMVEAMVVTAKAAVNARDALTASQRETLKKTIESATRVRPPAR